MKLHRIIALSFSFAIFSSDLDAQEIDLEAIQELLSQQSQQSFDESYDKKDLEDLSDGTRDEKFEISTQIFGHEFIRSNPKKLSANADLPVPNDYLIGLNDKLKVVLSGALNKTIKAEVGLDGTILLPEIGEVQIAGSSYLDAKRKIEDLYDSLFVGIDVLISISSLSAKKIIITGAVKTPGTYVVNPYTSISNSLSYAGGLEDYSSLRNITVISATGKVDYFDLYELLIFGNRSNDRILNAGDTVLIPSTNNFVEIKGAINRPFIYEYKDTDTFKGLTDFALGMTRNAAKDRIFVDEEVNNRIKTNLYSLDNSLNEKKITELFIPSNELIIQKSVKITGGGINEQTFQPDESLMFEDIVDSIKLSTNTYPFYFLVTRLSPNGLVRDTSHHSLADKSTFKNLVLNENTSVIFFTYEEIMENQNILAESFLDNFQEKSSLKATIIDQEKDFIYEELRSKDKNNSLESSELNEMHLDNLKMIMPSVIKPVLVGSDRYFLPIKGIFIPEDIFNYFDFNIALIEEDMNVSTIEGLKRGSYKNQFNSSEVLQINFPQKAQTAFEVEIYGQVSNPGIYLVNSATSLDDLYKLAGGFSSNAGESSIIFTRKSIKDAERKAYDSAKKIIIDSAISNLNNSLIPSESSASTSVLNLFDIANEIEFSGRLTGELQQNSINAINLILEPGDSIYVPNKPTLVAVLGEVFQPLTTTFENGKTYEELIRMAGGSTEYADLKGIYVINPNGTSRLLARRGLSQIANPGETIVVPKNIDKVDTLSLVSVATKIISDIAFAAASLNVLNN